jgi:hypothetical protein
MQTIILKLTNNKRKIIYFDKEEEVLVAKDLKHINL